jgi:hypothetical protein
MKNLLAVAVLLLLAKVSFGQVANPVVWDFTAKKINAATYEVNFTATLKKGWHLYSQATPEGGPEPTTFNIAKNPLLTLVGMLNEVGKLEQRFEPLFGVDVKQYSDKVVFLQRITIKGKAKTALTGTVRFMSCNEEMCLPPQTQKFTIHLQ